MEEIRDDENHLLCRADADRGILERTDRGNMIRVVLPPKGEMLFLNNRQSFTLTRRTEDGIFYVTRDHYRGRLITG